MGRQLFREEPVFRDALVACDEAIRKEAGFSVIEELDKPEETSRIHETIVVQPALFAVEVALAALLQSWGVVPAAVIGHSVGEIAAAHVSGMLDLAQAARLVCIRGRVMQKATGHGKMVSVSLDEPAAKKAAAGLEDRIGIAAVNDLQSVVLSGDVATMDSLVEKLAREGVETRPLRVNYAFHSPQMEPLLPEFTAGMGVLKAKPGSIPMLSTVTGKPLTHEELDVGYWGRNIRQAVRFADAISSVAADGYIFVEVGPHPVLTISMAQTLTAKNIESKVISTLRRDNDERKLALLALGALHAHGCIIDWKRFFPEGGRVVPLPTYPWQKQKYWLETTAHQADLRSAGLVSAQHPLLGAITRLADGDGFLLTGRLSLSEQPWLADHAVLDTVLVPATGVLELALAAARAVGQTGLSDLTLEAPLLLARRGDVRIQLVIQAAENGGRRSFSLFSQSDDASTDAPWTRNATGILAESAPAKTEADLTTWPPPGAQSIDIGDLYSRLSVRGYQYGPAFQGLTEVWRRGNVLFARVMLPETLRKDAGEYGLHPALLDAALHALSTDDALDDETVRLPFAFSDVALVATGAGELRVRLELPPANTSEQTISLAIADGSGLPVAHVGGLQVRPATAAQVRAAIQSTDRDIYRVDWKPVAITDTPTPIHGWVLGGDGRLAKELGLEWIANIEELVDKLNRDERAPERLLLDFTSAIGNELPLPELVQRETAHALGILQFSLAETRLSGTSLIWLTRKAIATNPNDTVDDLARASLWGLIRSARSENPGRVLRLVDIDDSTVSSALFTEMAEAELVWRYRTALSPRLQRSEVQAMSLTLPPAPHWRLHLRERGSLSDLEIIEAPDALVPLQSGQVRIAVRAAGVNFRDALNALGMVPTPWLGLELAGSVVEVGFGVEHVAVGDRVMGLGQGTFATNAIADARMVTRIPDHLSYPEAATIPVVFLTALYALEDLAGLQSGERLLVHAAAGGVGMAAIQLARHWGVEVFGTASPSKWKVLRTLGLDSHHIANSRDLSFANEFLANTNGAGVDVVLNALAREFVDASLRLLSRGGRFLEMGKTDIRDAETITTSHPSVRYRAFDLMEAGPERIQSMLEQLAKLFEQKALSPLPLSAYDLRHAPMAFKHLANGRNVGKLILQPPRSMDSNGTALITGGTGELGQSLAKHLVQNHGVKHLVLTSRRGANAPGAEKLVTALKDAGAETITLAACDIANSADVAALIEAIPAAKPLRSVFHLAGVLDDGLVTALTEERLAKAMLPKVAGAWNLHEQTRGLELSAFVLFSSVAGIIGNAGQANYAAANTFLDALAAYRRKVGLAGQSLAWGFWEQQGLGMTAHLDAADIARLQRQGFAPISVDAGLALLDVASGRPEAALVPIRLDLPRMQKAFGEDATIPALFRGLVQPALRRVGPTAIAAQALRGRLLGLSENERRLAVLELVCREIATVLGLAGADAVPVDKPLQVLGLDSLMAVELRNRLAARAETTLPATLAFDYPTPEAIAGLLLRKAFADVETSAPASVVVPSHFDEPIAIVGMACRTPGGVSDPESFWALLELGRDAVGPFPNRWDAETLYDPNPDAVGKSVTREGGFLDDIAEFDAAFFGISPREAAAMDPQQRLVLETAWEALERASISTNALSESSTGIYLGSMGSDYGFGARSLDALDGYVGTGTASSVLAGRLAYVLGLQGPAMTVDTACSSSLVAIHLAAAGLRQGECDLALAGGVQVMCTPATFVEFSRLRGLAPDGRCKSFSAEANGAGWAEGCGVLVLKRLSDAKRDGDRIFAVLRGSAVNQDGRSNGLTAPNGPSQQRVIRRALATSGLLPTDIDAVEAHGTGTKLGDPIEVGSLIEVFGPTRREESPLWLGSSKSNIGHAQAAAGVLGVMKMVLALQHERLPKTLHAEQPSPHIAWEGSGIRLLQSLQPWPKQQGHVRRAGISSFGVSGTNAHVILEEAPEFAAKPEIAPRSAELVVLSAKTATALDAHAKRLSDYLKRRPDRHLGDIAYSLATTRSAMEHRLAIAATSCEGLSGALDEIARGQTPLDAVRGTTIGSKSSKVAFVFPGQGSQWVGMGRQLSREEPAFRNAITVCDEAIRKEAGFSVIDELDKPEETSRIHETIVAQPALFAVEVALAALLQSWGVVPAAVIGHSVGEIAAAHVSGMLDLAQAARLVCLRARVMQKATGHGKMVSVSLDERAATKAISGLEARVSIAAINDPNSVVLSGDVETIDSLVQTFAREGVETRPLRVNYAFHSPQMEPLVAEFVGALGALQVKPATIPMLSTVTGKPLTHEELDVGYWGRNIRQAVRFADAITTSNERVFVEVGPHPVLAMSIEQTLSALKGESLIVSTLRRDRDERKQTLLAVGTLHTHGIAIDWKQFFPDGGRVVELPTYAWQRQRYWIETPATKKTVAGQVYDGFNSLIQATGEDERWETYLTFGPLRDIVPVFSWMSWSVDADLPQKHREIVLDAQREMRRVLFRHVDFATCRRVLDFGCGYATDLMVLAKRHPHLQLDGYTISTEQAASD
ncbi:MAG TPA: SDR family NAD(P)-dependent oxidoreductase, partial [Polyangium sp.]|nr:SDR family NAD(P)-dependent oxidoreductase [Polyangium sp.]